WDTNLMTFYYDGNSQGAANIQNNINNTGAFHNHFFILLNMAVGGSWPGNPDGTTVFPANYNVDYVRVSQQGAATATPTAAPTATPTTSGGGGGGITSGSFYTVVNKNSGKCMDAAAAATANGTVVQQYTCNSSAAQNWQFVATDSGYFKILTQNNTAQGVDVTGGTSATADG